MLGSALLAELPPDTFPQSLTGLAMAYSMARLPARLCATHVHFLIYRLRRMSGSTSSR